MRATLKTRRSDGRRGVSGDQSPQVGIPTYTHSPRSPIPTPEELHCFRLGHTITLAEYVFMQQNGATK